MVKINMQPKLTVVSGLSGAHNHAGVQRSPRAAHVLVVDDSRSVRQGLVEELTRLGHRCSEAADGAEGFARFYQHIPDLVISDSHMPRIDGLTLLRILRGRHPQLPFVFVTGEPGHAGFPAKAKALGATGVFHKPLDMGEFLDSISRLLPPIPSS